jgi:bifunctional non-homologous end joining protein LigD
MRIQVRGYVENRGIDLYRLAKEKELEGIVAKRKTSTYRPGKRSTDWLKIKARPQQEFVVCGFTERKGSRKHFGALILGAYRNGRLRYFGHSGTGFSEKGLKEAIDRLKPLFIDESPVEKSAKNPRENSVGSAKSGLRRSLCGVDGRRAVAPNYISRMA